MRFHQAVAFLETDQLLELSKACDDTGYAGMYLCDHIFFPKELGSRYPYSPHQDGSPIWSPETDWPDIWCVVSAMAAVTTNLRFTSGVYIAPARDVFTAAKLVGTAAYLSDNRVHLGVGVGWCEEEFDGTGQEFHNRGKRLDDMIPALRELWRGGWVEYHGAHYDFGPLQMNPTPTAPIPIYGGGHSEPALRRAARLCDGWLAAGAYARPALPGQDAGLPEGSGAGRRSVRDLPDAGGAPRRRAVPRVRGGGRHRHGLRAVDAGRRR